MMILWYCYYHFVWATKNRQMLILPEMEKMIFEVVALKTKEMQSQLHAVNAMPDHLHIAVSLYPNVTISHWVKHVKGATSYEINQTFTNLENRFRWQRGYSVHTLGQKVLPFVIRYIENQKEHHANATTEKYLEDIPTDDE